MFKKFIDAVASIFKKPKGKGNTTLPKPTCPPITGLKVK